MSDSLVERLIRSADSWAPLAPTIARIEREAASALESLQAENERLKRLIVEHNRELCEMCDKRDCGFKAYYRRCPECPREYVIAAHQASASSDEPEETAAALGALGATYGDAHPGRAIEFYAAEIVKRAESAEARAKALEAALRECVRVMQIDEPRFNEWHDAIDDAEKLLERGE